MLFTPALPATSEFRYDMPIPLGAEVDLVVGLSEEDIKIATEKYYGIGETAYGQLEAIRYNFIKSAYGDKYYAGAYWKGDPYLLDAEGNRLVGENGKPLKNLDRDLCILVTDMSIIPKDLNHPKLFFEEVKYSEKELLQFRQNMWDKFENKGLVGSMLETKENKIYILLLEGFDVVRLFEVVPEDVCSIEFVEDEDTMETLATPVYNGKLVSILDNFQTIGNGSIGFPVSWGTNNSNKGWITAGHIGGSSGTRARYNGSSTDMGTPGNVKVSGNCDVQTILRTNTNYCSHHQGPFGDTINYQESTDASLPVIDTWVEYYGQASNQNIYTTIIGVDGSYTENSNTKTPLVVVDSTSQKGDSGGPVLRDNENDTYTAVGIITGKITSGKYSGKMAYSRIRHIRNSITNLSVAAFS